MEQRNLHEAGLRAPNTMRQRDLGISVALTCVAAKLWSNIGKTFQRIRLGEAPAVSFNPAAGLGSPRKLLRNFR